MNAAKWKKTLLEVTGGGTYINPEEARELAELLQPAPVGESVDLKNPTPGLAVMVVMKDGTRWPGYTDKTPTETFIHWSHGGIGRWSHHASEKGTIRAAYVLPFPGLPPEPSLEERITAALTKRNVCCNGDIKSLIDDLAAVLGGSHE